MPRFIASLARLARCSAGASALEYAIIASLVSVAAVGAFMMLGAQSNEQFEAVSEAYADTR